MKLVAITSCSTGKANTYMAAEALMLAATDLGYELKVETQGSTDAESILTKNDIANADAVIIATNIPVEKDRFVGKKLVQVDTEDAIKNAKKLLENSLNSKIYNGDKTVKAETVPTKSGKTAFSQIYGHLMTGVSYMLPFVVAGGILTALSFALGGIAAEGPLAQASMQLGQIAMGLMFPILAGYIAFSIGDKPALAPGVVAGMLVSGMNAGFLGALIGGFIAGYIILFLNKTIKLPPSFSALMPIFILPVVSIIVTGSVLIFIVGAPMTALNSAMTNWLESLTGISSVALGLILGTMMSIDVAGPIGKSAYFFGLAGLSSLAQGETSNVMAAIMAAGMTSPLAVAVSSTLVGRKKYTKEQREAGKSAWVLGLSFVTEGALPFVIADPVRVLFSVVVGSMVTGGLSMYFNCGIAVPHGGIFIFFIPGAVSNVWFYALSIATGSLVGGVLMTLLKKDAVVTDDI